MCCQTQHRDFYPQRCAPLDSYANDIKETGPRYIQWNLCLCVSGECAINRANNKGDHHWKDLDDAYIPRSRYDDSVLWVVPGSHTRRATPEEDAQLYVQQSTPSPTLTNSSTPHLPLIYPDVPY